MKSSYLFFILILSQTLFADPLLLKNDPKRPVNKISHDLGIKPAEFIACFENVTPAAQGLHPTKNRVHANKQVLLFCLQQANPSLTNEQLDTVMDRYRPGGHDAQQPQ